MNTGRLSLSAWFPRFFWWMSCLLGVLLVEARAGEKVYNFQTESYLEKRSAGGIYDATSAYWTNLKKQVQASEMTEEGKANGLALIEATSSKVSSPIGMTKEYAGTKSSIVITASPEPTYEVSSGHAAGSAWVIGVTLVVADRIIDPPTHLILTAYEVSPTSAITSNLLEANMGDKATLVLTKGGTASWGALLSGPDFLKSDPLSVEEVTLNTSGTAIYSYKVNGSVRLSWKSDDMSSSSFTLTYPDKSEETDLTSTSVVYVTKPGQYKITQTNSAGVLSDSQDVVIPTATASVTITVKAPPPTTSVPLTTIPPSPPVPTTTIPYTPPTSVPPTSVPTTSIPPVGPTPTTTAPWVPTTSIPPRITTTIPATGALSAVLVPELSSFTVADKGSPMHGRTYPRLWGRSGDWHAYLGREGLRLRVVFSVADRVSGTQLQCRRPGAKAWELLAESHGDSGSLRGSELLTVCLGERSADNPLIPASVKAGKPEIGEWRFRARARSSAGLWSDWSPEVPIAVELPLVVKSETLQTLPPAGKTGEWFEASEPRTFNLKVWVP